MRSFLCLIALALLAGSLNPAAGLLQAPGGPDIEEFTRQSHFVFLGKVEKLHSSNLKVLPATQQMVLVRVAEVLYAPPTLNNFTGWQITVQLKQAGMLRPGQEAVFFTNGWLYGESIAVTEVAHVSATGVAELRKQIADVHARMEDERLQTRISRAALVIVGKVRATQEVEKQPRIGSEHAPEWWRAQIDVESVEKGALPAREVAILFPASTDEMWLNSPKFKPGDQGIWILQDNQQEKGFPVTRLPGLTALDPLDFQSTSQLERVRRLVKATR